MAADKAGPSGEPGAFPKPFVSDWMLIGSRTVDSGHRFVIEVGEDGFSATRATGPYSVSDLFGDMDYWPPERVWSGTAARLGPLLDNLAEVAGMEQEALHARAAECFECVGICLPEYLADEEAAVGDPDGAPAARLDEARRDVHYGVRISGLSSEDFQSGTEYAGAELAFGTDGWSAELLEPDGSEELFIPEEWSGETFDELIDARGLYCLLADVLPWTREELAGLLVASDLLWREHIQTETD